MPESAPQRRTIGELANTNPEALGVGADPRAHFKYVDLSSVTSGTVAWNSAPEVTLLTAPSRARRVLRRGDVLFGTVRPNLQSHGYVDWAGNSAPVGSTGFSVIRAKAGVSDPRYLFHCVMSSGVAAQAIRDAVGSSYPALNDSDVRRFEVYAPPLGEQVAVAQVLDTLDTTIRQTEAIIEKLKHVKQGLLHDLLTRGIDANGELRPPQSQAPHLYKDSPLGWIPREWRFGSIESFLDRIIDYRGKTPTKTPSGIPLITAKNVRLGYIDPEPREFIGPDSFDRWMTRGIPKRGDVLFTTEAPLGNVAQVDSDEQLAFAQRMIILQLNEATVGTFLKFLMLGQQFRRRLFAMGSGSTVEGIQQSTFRRLSIAVPESVAEQREIVQRLASADSRVDCELTLLGKWQEAKSGLMDDLLTGRVRVTPLLEAATP